MAALSFALLRPAYPFMPPDLSQRRTQVVQLLPFAQVTQLQTWVWQQPVLLSPADYLEKLRAQFPDTSVAWTFYAGWEYLDLLEKTRQAYDQREEDLAHAEELLTRYEERCHEALRGEVTPAQPLPLQLAPADSRPQLEESAEHLRVFRVLPWPDRGYTRAQVLQLLEAGRADLAQVYSQRSRLEEAKQKFVGHQDVWTAWLTDLAQASEKFTQAQYLKAYDAPLPPPPKGIP
ncbi:MAG: hypothetical protein KIS61_09500 [Candidatus Eremiobacteraeota bacterium]|nr:hypothetical protein [Candidatus Eremiobacteraeota bacterium]